MVSYVKGNPQITLLREVTFGPYQLVDDTVPRIPTDLTIHLVDEEIHLVDEEGDWEEGFQVVREPVQVRVVNMMGST